MLLIGFTVRCSTVCLRVCIGFKGCLRRRRTGRTVFLNSKCLHKFALGLKVVLEDVEQVEQYFSTVSALYKFALGLKVVL